MAALRGEGMPPEDMENNIEQNFRRAFNGSAGG
jgi:hypothetical protein